MNTLYMHEPRICLELCGKNASLELQQLPSRLPRTLASSQNNNQLVCQHDGNAVDHLHADDQQRWESEVEEYEKRFPHYRSHLAQKHKHKLNDKGAIDIKLTQLGIKKPCTARHFFIKEQVEVGVTLYLLHDVLAKAQFCDSSNRNQHAQPVTCVPKYSVAAVCDAY